MIKSNIPLQIITASLNVSAFIEIEIANVTSDLRNETYTLYLHDHYRIDDVSVSIGPRNIGVVITFLEYEDLRSTNSALTHVQLLYTILLDKIKNNGDYASQPNDWEYIY